MAANEDAVAARRDIAGVDEVAGECRHRNFAARVCGPADKHSVTAGRDRARHWWLCHRKNTKYQSRGTSPDDDECTPGNTADLDTGAACVDGAVGGIDDAAGKRRDRNLRSGKGLAADEDARPPFPVANRTAVGDAAGEGHYAGKMTASRLTSTEMPLPQNRDCARVADAAAESRTADFNGGGAWRMSLLSSIEMPKIRLPTTMPVSMIAPATLPLWSEIAVPAPEMTPALLRLPLKEVLWIRLWNMCCRAAMAPGNSPVYGPAIRHPSRGN